MAYTYYDIVNEVLRATGEVPFASVTEFNNAADFAQFAKDTINVSIRDICNFQDNRWSFQREEGSQTVTVGDQRYNFDSDVAFVDWESFYIAKNASLNSPDHRELTFRHWVLYTQGQRKTDYNNAGDSDKYEKPDLVTNPEENANTEFLVSPIPDEAYTVKWAQYAEPTELSADTDVPVIPQRFRNIIVHRAKYYIHKFREDDVQASRSENEYKRDVFDMRRILIPTPLGLYTKGSPTSRSGYTRRW